MAAFPFNVVHWTAARRPPACSSRCGTDDLVIAPVSGTDFPKALWVTLNEPQRGHNTVFASTGQVFGEHNTAC